MGSRIKNHGGFIMANFNGAYKLTLEHEGGYNKDPDDVGGETYKGISRRYHPRWKGWQLIDGLKLQYSFPDNLDRNADLDDMIKEFYKDNYWNLFCGDKIPNQLVANELFDTGVNMGIGRAVKYLQMSLNLLNRNEKNYPDIVEDGKFGSNTLRTLRIYLRSDKVHYLLKIMNILQGMHYIEYAKKSAIQERYMRGWLSRVDITK